MIILYANVLLTKVPLKYKLVSNLTQLKRRFTSARSESAQEFSESFQNKFTTVRLH